ncbi:MAG: tetratricopeptide repeat protein, partial [Limisphaerales bacterium]
GCLRWRRDVLPTLPFWVSSVGLGLVTSWLERTHVGARGPDWALSFTERCLIAGRALWFYAGKILWPANFCFIYPRWQLDSRSAGQWLWPAGVVVTLVALWVLRRRLGRGPLAAVLLFIGTLFPLLGFFNGYFMRYSFVSDHWAYLSSLALLALAAASISLIARKLDAPGLVSAVAIVALPVLWIQTRSHSAIFADSETLYRTTLALNPNADLAHNNLGLLLARAGEFDEAIPHLERAVALRPSSAHAHNNLANAFRVTGRTREAVEQYELALKLEPNNANTLNNLALLLASSSEASVRRGARAIELAQRARELTFGRNPVVLATLAAAFAEAGRFADALKTQQQAIDLVSGQPDSGVAQALQMQLQLYQRGLPFRDSGP